MKNKISAMKKVKLDYRQSGHRGRQQRSIIEYFKTMLKLENIMILVLIVLAHQIHGIHSQGKHRFCFSFITISCVVQSVSRKCVNVLN